MSTEKALLDAIAANPDDTDRRLVYADWLEENDQQERADLIRVQCELEPLRKQLDDPRRQKLIDEEDHLCNQNSDLLRKQLERLLGSWLRADRLRPEWRRGFVECISCPAKWFVEQGDVLRQQLPLLQEMAMFRVHGWGDRLAQCPHLQGLRRLDLPCWYSSGRCPGPRRFTASGEAGSVALLAGRLRGGRGGDLPAARRRVRLAPPARILGCESERGERSFWLDLVNQTAKRDLARYVDDNDRFFTFAPDFYPQFFPGRLPDGTQVFGALAQRGVKALRCLFFDAAGRQIREERVPLPDESLQFWRSDDYLTGDKEKEWHARVVQHLGQTLGFRPALIRIKELHFEDPEPFVFVERYPYDDTISCYPDDPAADPDTDYHGALGELGWLYKWVKKDMFSFTYYEAQWDCVGDGHVGAT